MTEQECSHQQISSVERGPARLEKGGEWEKDVPYFWAEIENLVLKADVCAPALSPSTTTSRKMLTPHSIPS